MNEEFLEEYISALKKLNDIAEEQMKIVQKGDLVDDQLMSDYKLADADLRRLGDQLAAMNQQLNT